MGSQSQLNAYLALNSTKGFSLGTHDCLLWVNGAYEALNGEPIDAREISRYKSHGPAAVLRSVRERFGAETLTEALDHMLTRVDGIPPRGAIVSTKKAAMKHANAALGIANGNVALFLGQKGYEPLPIDEIDWAWI